MIFGLLLAASVTCARPGWTFTEVERPVFRVTGAPGSAVWQVENWRKRPVRRGVKAVDGTLTFSSFLPGYYRARVEGAAADGALDFTFCVVASNRCRNAESFFAADAAISGCSRRGSYECPWYDGDCPRVTSELLGLCGLVHTRERLEWGNFISPTREKRDFTRYLHTAKWMKAHGVVCTGCFHDAPGWNRKPGKKLPADLVELYRFMEDAARTFDPYYDSWEFWNEMEHSSTTEPVWEYAAALKAYALGTRSGSAKAVILPGSLSFIEHGGYGQTMFDAEAAKYVQAFNIHTYEPIGGYDGWHADARKFMEEAGIAGWQMWLTESSVHMEGLARAKGPRPGVMAHDAEQELILAEFYPKGCVRHQQAGVYRDWHFMFGCYNERGGRLDWGSMRRDGTVKPIHAAMAALTHAVGDARLLGERKTVSGVRSFVYEHPDGRQTLVFWRESDVDRQRGGTVRLKDDPKTEFDVPAEDGAYELVDLMGTPSVVRAEAGRLRCRASRFPQYLHGLKSVSVDVRRRDSGALAKYIPATDEDLTVVIRPEVDLRDFSVIGRKCRAELNGDTGRIRLEVWNLSDQPKSGRLTASRGSFGNVPKSVSVPPWGCVALDAVYHPPTDGDTAFPLDIAGVFNGKRITRVRIPLIHAWRFLRECRTETWARLDRPEAWTRNDSGQKYKCSFDEGEKAVCFETEWDGSTGAWFFPVVRLKNGESLKNAKYVEFEVKSWQDKVENDMQHVQMMCLYAHDSGKDVPFDAPTFGWEKRRVSLPAHPEGIHSFRIGGLPAGRHLKFWVRNFRVMKSGQ